MGAPDLIFELRRKGYSIRADGGYLDISPADNLPPELVQQLKQSKVEILTELQREARRQQVITELDRLINIVAKHHGFTETDVAHAFEIAHADAENALVCFRELSAEIEEIRQHANDGAARANNTLGKG